MYLKIIFYSLVILCISFKVQGSYETQPEQDDVRAPDYAPTYVKTGQYARAHNGVYPYGTKTGGVKTGNVKTRSYAGTKTGGVKKSCPGRPPTPQNSKTKCIDRHCKATCLQDYKFANGQTALDMACVNEEWKIQDSNWNPEITFASGNVPPCEPVCMPECQNKGICINPGQCDCPQNFNGPQCQYEKKPCMTMPFMPTNAVRNCLSSHCNIKCIEGHQFPDGSTIATVLCKNGDWAIGRADWATVPDCIPICTPPCENAGVCLSLNTCQCPQHFRGPQCQYSATACSIGKLNFNGGYKCSGDYEKFVCKLSCAVGTEFSSPPADAYTCEYSVGKFLPEIIPRCEFQEDNAYTLAAPIDKYQHYTNPTRSYNNTKQSYNLVTEYSTQPNFQVITPSSGACFTWGGTHYKTFDGKVYRFESACPHILVRDSLDHMFSVVVQNQQSLDGTSNGESEILIFLQSKEYKLSRSEDASIIFQTPKRILPIPSQLTGIRVEMVAHTVVVTLDTLDVQIKWDTLQMIQVKVSESLWNRTEGLCGILDGNINNDLFTETGKRPRSMTELANSWRSKKIGVMCEENTSELHYCLLKSDKIRKDAEIFCNNLISKKRFKACAQLMDISHILESCKWDYCGSPPDQNPEERACNSLAVYASQCALSGIASLKNWRDEDTCPMTCTGGKIYMPCGPVKQPCCGSIFSVSKIDDEVCSEGCFCPNGTYLNDGKCILKENCPCRLRGRTFPKGITIPKDCNTCTCEGGEWVCSQLTCGARCEAIGDPHYTTFDGHRYDFMGSCSYHFVMTDNFTVDVENVACSGAISEMMNLVPVGSSTEGGASCTKAVKIQMQDVEIHLKQRGAVVVNGQDVAHLPIKIKKITIRSASSLFIVVKLPNGVEVWWDGMTRVYVDVPASFRGKTAGLCGTFNNNQKDDFLTPEGDVEQAVIPFANKWKTVESCKDVRDMDLAHPCEVNVQNKPTAEKLCANLKSKIFEECYWFVDVELYYQDCMYDMCSCEGSVDRCLCPIVGAYATACANSGVVVPWRSYVEECEIHCSGGQTFQTCADSCSRTCWDVSHLDVLNEIGQTCRPKCVEGCNCPVGQVVDESGECIPTSQCPCYHDGIKFLAGYKEVRPGRKERELCTCVSAKWQCTPATDNDIVNYPRAADIKEKCSAVNQEEFTTCVPNDLITCKNMHLPPSQSPTHCKPGCQCIKGYVLDSVSKRCIKAQDCPCHHGGQSYADGHKRQEECNTCDCKKGKWECTDRVCNGVCSAWGDSHFTTFDGKKYDFQGVCTYLLASGKIPNSNEEFVVEIQNGACGTTGATCSKIVTLKVGSGDKAESVSFLKDNSLPDVSGLQKIKLRTAGLFVFADVPSIGLVLQWDRATRAYIKIQPKWKGRLKGLCGNYNNDARDDFQTPSGGGVSEASALLFADSWRLQQFCPPATEVEDHCEQRPSRKLWAVKSCTVLKRAPFTACHSEISPTDYVQRCEKDACACDSGGDCECYCTVLAAYADACTSRGIIIPWRSQQLCPMQCDEECSNYSPCIPSCPVETCDNTLDYEGIKISCKTETCIEGCKQKKTCQEGFVYKNGSLIECVPRTTCKPECMKLPGGRVVLEGEIIKEDECHVCKCSRGEEICKGQPCTTVPYTTTESERRHEMPIDCETGWTPWINNHDDDAEPLPSKTEMFNFIESSACDHENMTQIECRTVKDHLSPKETGQDVECSLERGLVCKPNKGLPCPDFEIRVFCNCAIRTPLPVLPTETTHPTVGTTISFINEIKLIPEKNIPVPAEICDNSKVNIHKPYPGDCTKFYHCAVGHGPPEHPDTLVKKCADGTMFNPTSMICDWPASVIAQHPECASTTTTVTTTQRIVPIAIVLPTATTHPTVGTTISFVTETELATEKDGDIPLPATTTTVATTQRIVPITPTFEIKPTCPPGKIWSECAVPCVKVCHYYDKFLKEDGKCNNGEVCVPACIDEKVAKIKCEKNYLWRDSNTCVKEEDCTCRSKDGKPVKPGEVVNESECKICQCVRNHYICDSSSCKKTNLLLGSKPKKPTIVATGEPASTTPVTQPPLVVTEEIITIPTTVLTSPECDPDRYTNIMWGDEPISPAAFKASSVMGDMYQPQNAKLYGKGDADSAGSWSPQINNENQYIDVKLPRSEPVYGVIMQGSPLFDEYVTSYEVMYSQDGQAYSYVEGYSGRPQLFRGPIDNELPVKDMFDIPLEAKYIRIKPKTWHHGIAVRFEIIGCSPDITTTEATTSWTNLHVPQCKDPMGIGEGILPLDHILVSSENPLGSKTFINISKHGSWKPLYSSPGEWVLFDFTDTRTLTGIATKGGETGWVTGYEVRYSPDLNSWNSIMEDGENKVFPANFDSDTAVVNTFPRPLHSRYLKLIPVKWHNQIEMRVEPHGCFLPYVINDENGVITMPPEVTTEIGCEVCPGVITNSQCCSGVKSFFDGEECTTRALCPCYVGLIRYPVGEIFKSSKCEECACKLGGIADCKPKVCPPCDDGLVPKTSTGCECQCVPCPPETKICPTSKVCVNVTSWCDGIEDCPDDEKDCKVLETTMTPTTAVPVTTTEAPKKDKKKCETPTCGPGYRVGLLMKKPKTYESSSGMSDIPISPDSLFVVSAQNSARKGYNRFYKGGPNRSTASFGGGRKTGPFAGTKTPRRGLPIQHRPVLSRPESLTTSLSNDTECPQFKCIADKPLPTYNRQRKKPMKEVCSLPKCPPNYKVKIDKTQKLNTGCASYICEPPPKQDAVCNVTGRTFSTFDGTEFKYDVCDHVLARDAVSDKWNVVVLKNCSQSAGCVREIIITQDDNQAHVLSNLEFIYNGYQCTTQQAKEIGRRYREFTLTKLGNNLLFKSMKYGFLVVFNTQGDIRIGVIGLLNGVVDGLCGFFDHKPENDKRLPNGQSAASTEKFGDSWAKPDLPPDACEAKVCPLNLQKQAWEMCDVVNNKIFEVCGKQFDMNKWKIQCLESICECAQSSKEKNKAKDCLCDIMQTFATDCQAADTSITLQGWRSELNCPAECPPPLVHNDCYRRRCEPTCDNTGDKECAVVSGVCFPGCYCPEGKVRKGDKCITPDECRDCVCEGKGNQPKYVTFDRQDVDFAGNCTYIVARDVNDKANPQFEVFITNGPCEDDPSSICAEALHIVHSPHVLHIEKSFGSQQLDVMVDGTTIFDYPHKSDWIEIQTINGKDVKLLIPAVQLEVSSVFKSTGFAIKIPSNLYSNKTEGLCGVCAGEHEDLLMSDGNYTADENQYGLSWLAKNDSLSKLDVKIEDKCVEIKKEDCIPLPPDEDPCFKMLDVNVFGKCHLAVDPVPFIASCQKDLCSVGKHVGLCPSIEVYAKECADAGFCVDWRTNDICPYKCDEKFEYKACELGCTLTCDNYEHMTSEPDRCEMPQFEGCFCPSGQVLVNDTCIEHTKCFPCDAEGKHYAGDEWQVDACKKCSCTKSEKESIAQVACTTQSCAKDMACPRNMVAEQLSKKPSECCPEFICVPTATETPNCEEKQKPDCGYGQEVKLETLANGCQQFICKCKPQEECEPISKSEAEVMEPGMERLVDHSGCCPKAELKCNVEKCPTPLKCPPLKNLVTKNNTGSCCPVYVCEPPRDKCLYYLEYDSAPSGGERKLNESKGVLKEPGAIWMDGPCRSCACKIQDGSLPISQCAVTQCPTITHSDDFVIEAVLTPYTCCPEPSYTACKYEGITYKAGETWKSNHDTCCSYTCEMNAEMKLEKKTTMQQCDTECQPGWLYIPAPEASHQCCGNCKAVACVVDGVKHDIGEEWSSPDHCKKFFCLNNNETLQVQSVDVQCPEVLEHTKLEYELKEESVPGECCKKLVSIACKVNGTIHKEGTTWPSSDPCKNITCTRDSTTGQLVKVEGYETCSTDCQPGWTYEPAKDKAKCCGQCVQTECLDGGILKPEGSTWLSADNCTTFTCDRIKDSLTVSGNKEFCPDITDCPVENIYRKGCCKVCKDVPRAHSLCTPENINEKDTINLIREERVNLGVCVNKSPIKGFKECKGGCNSGTVFNNATGSHDSDCQCCQAVKYEAITVTLHCENGSTFKKQVPVPKTCECAACTGGKHLYTKNPTKTGGNKNDLQYIFN